MRKIIFFLLIVIVVLLVLIAMHSSDKIIVGYSDKLAHALETNDYFPGLKIKNVSFAGAKLSSFNSVIWKNVSLQTIVTKKYHFVSPGIFDIHINTLQITLSDLARKQFILTADGLSIVPSSGDISSDGLAINGSLENGRLKLVFEFNFFNLGTASRQLRDLCRKTIKIVTDGRTVIPLYFSCISTFNINKHHVKALVTTHYDNKGHYSLVVNREFFKTVGWFMSDNLTDAEAELLSKNPFRVPELLKIMTYARKESEKYGKLKAIPEDAYRHVLWSYLLTKRFGPVFARHVTDAHEEGDPTDTAADHIMDYHNNAIGRQYALKHYRKDEILDRVLSDPNVIRTPR